MLLRLLIWKHFLFSLSWSVYLFLFNIFKENFQFLNLSLLALNIYREMSISIKDRVRYENAVGRSRNRGGSWQILTWQMFAAPCALISCATTCGVGGSDKGWTAEITTMFAHNKSCLFFLCLAYWPHGSLLWGSSRSVCFACLMDIVVMVAYILWEGNTCRKD